MAFLVIVVSYSSMFCSIYKTGINATDVRSRLHKDVAVANRFFFIVFSDALCWIPIFLVKTLSLLKVEIPGMLLVYHQPLNMFLIHSFYVCGEKFFFTENTVNECWWWIMFSGAKTHWDKTFYTNLQPCDILNVFKLAQKKTLKNLERQISSVIMCSL